MKWFAVRTVVRHTTSSRGKSIYEERVLVYRTRTPLQAAKRAKRDVEAYLDANPKFSSAGEPVMFALNVESSNLDGAEVWSSLHNGPSNSRKFWADRYERFAYK